MEGSEGDSNSSQFPLTDAIDLVQVILSTHGLFNLLMISAWKSNVVSSVSYSLPGVFDQYTFTVLSQTLS